MAIRQYITLEGAEQVVANLKKISDAGEQALATFQKSGQQFVPAEDFSKSFQSAVSSAQAAGEATSLFGVSIKGLVEALHVLRPALAEAGVGLVNIRELSFLAGKSFEVLALTIGGAFVVALAKVGENADRARAQLAGLLGSGGQGNRAFDALSKSAVDLGTSVTGLEPAFEAATEALQRFKATTSGVKFVAFDPSALPGFANVGNAVENFIKILRASGDTEDVANQKAAAFFSTLRDGGRVTEQMLNALKPGAVSLFAQAMGRGATNAEQFKAQIDSIPTGAQKVLTQLANFGAQAQKAFDTRSVTGIKDAFVSIGEALARLAEQLTLTDIGRVFVAGLELIRKGIDLITEAAAKAAQAIRKLDAAANNIPGVKQFVAFLNRFSGVDAAQAKAAADQASSAFNQVGVAAGSAGSAAQQGSAGFDAFGNSLENAVRKAGDVTRITKNFQGFIPTAKSLEAPAQEISSAVDQLIQDVTSKASEFLAAGMTGGQNITKGVTQGVEQNPPDYSKLSSQLTNEGPALTAAAQAIWNAVKEVLSRAITIPVQVQSGAGAGSGLTEIPFASGGYVRGPGSTTSDSILARLSNMEYVIRASAVKFYGVDLLHALNAMRLPRNLFKGFSLGGLVLPPFPTPAFAQGGLVQSGQQRSLTLVLDGKSFAMAGSKNVIDDLERAADLHNLSRIGKAPGWIR